MKYALLCDLMLNGGHHKFFSKPFGKEIISALWHIWEAILLGINWYILQGFKIKVSHKRGLSEGKHCACYKLWIWVVSKFNWRETCRKGCSDRNTYPCMKEKKVQNRTHTHWHLLYIHLLIIYRVDMLRLIEPCNSFAETEIMPQPIQVFPFYESDKSSPGPSKSSPVKI